MILTGPAGDTIRNPVTVMQQVGLDSYSAKLMFGSWLWWSDQVNHAIRLVSPQGFAAGRLANLSPEQSSLNKQDLLRRGQPDLWLSGIRSEYLLLRSGSCSIARSGDRRNMQPSARWKLLGGPRRDYNSSSNQAINGDNYTRLTNYIAATLAAGMGQFVGQVINADLFRSIRSCQLSFLQNMFSQGLLGSTRRESAIQRDLRHVQQPGEQDWPRLCSVGRSGAIPIYQRKIHRQCRRRPDSSGLCTNATRWTSDITRYSYVIYRRFLLVAILRLSSLDPVAA